MKLNHSHSQWHEAKSLHPELASTLGGPPPFSHNFVGRACTLLPLLPSFLRIHFLPYLFCFMFVYRANATTEEGVEQNPETISQRSDCT